MHETEIDFLGFEGIGFNHLYRARELFRTFKLGIQEQVTKKEKLKMYTNINESNSNPACCTKICDF